jgi:hypothetical protein
MRGRKKKSMKINNNCIQLRTFFKTIEETIDIDNILKCKTKKNKQAKDRQDKRRKRSMTKTSEEEDYEDHDADKKKEESDKRRRVIRRKGKEVMVEEKIAVSNAKLRRKRIKHKTK